MITRTITRKELHKLLAKLDPTHKSINWEMTKFRHAVFQVVDKCHGISRCNWGIQRERQLTVFRAFFNTKIIECTYNWRTEKVKVTDGKSSTEIHYSMLADTVYELQPKKKIVKVKVHGKK